MSFLIRVVSMAAVLASLPPAGAAAAALGAAGPAATLSAAAPARGNYRCTRAYHHCRFNTDDKQRCEAVRAFCTKNRSRMTN